MNVSPLLRTVSQTISFVVPRILSVGPLTSIANRTIHHICNRQSLLNICTNKISSIDLLEPSVPIYNLTCGLKMKTFLHRRCKHCQRIWKSDRMYIICKAKPRHNAVQRKKAERNTWILTSVSQSPVREW